MDKDEKVILKSDTKNADYQPQNEFCVRSSFLWMPDVAGAHLNPSILYPIGPNSLAASYDSGLTRAVTASPYKRIFDRLREEHQFTGGYTIVKDYVRGEQLRGREMFIPLTHAHGEAQADFGEALVVIAGVEQKARKRPNFPS
jgi:hypothetical protein